MSGDEPIVQERVSILDKEYTVACPPQERDALMESARLLDTRMREIRRSGKIIGTDRIAVIAALNIAHELIQERAQGRGYTDSLHGRIVRLQERIDEILADEDPQLKL